MCAFTLLRRTTLGLCHYGIKLKPGMREVYGWRRRVGRDFRRPVSGGDWGQGWLLLSRRRTDVTLRHDASAATAARIHSAARPARNLPQPIRWQPPLIMSIRFFQKNLALSFYVLQILKYCHLFDTFYLFGNISLYT